MKLTQEQLGSYQRDGYLFLPELFSAPEMEVLHLQIPEIFAEASERRIEPLIYDAYYRSSLQNLALTLIEGDKERPFVLSTPRLAEEGLLFVGAAVPPRGDR
jgi:hypothetical protein